MLFGFEINLTDGTQDFGVIAAADKEAAEKAMFLERGDDIESVSLLDDVETLVASQYRGFAYMTTERA